MMQAPDIGKVILEHTADSRVIELPFGLGEWHLPHGWMIGGTDFAPTKHVVFMALAAFLVFITIWYGGRQVTRRHASGKGPRGFGAAVEAMVLFVRNDVAIANIGHGGDGPKGYLKTIVMIPPGMKGPGAVAMAFIMTPVELIGKIVKPFALCLRLFANMTAGHFVILALVGLIFVFANWVIAAGTVLFVLFMMCLELLVAFLQAYIFALLTSVFIGLMQHEH